MHSFRARVLIVDDEESNTTALRRILEQEAYAVIPARNGREALNAYRARGADIVITDVRMPEMSGFALLKALRKLEPNLPIVLLTAFGTVDDAVEAMKLGAVDFLAKPITRARVLRALQDCLARVRPERAAPAEDLLIGHCAAMVELKRTIRMVGPTRASVVIQGESGTGKEVVAESLHRESGLSGKLVSINCAAIPEALLESELFGYERGAFTGAVGAKRGLFEAADRGTLFLDEIGEMPVGLQAKFLRVLENGTYLRVGGVEPRKAEVRVIAATNADLAKRVQAGGFREDLWFRLNVIQLALPPLRDRGEDVIELALHCLRRAGAKYGRAELRFSPAALAAMRAHSWPGNVRELVNAVERAVVLTTADEIDAGDLRLPSGEARTREGRAALTGELTFPLGTSLQEIEAEVIRKTLAAMDGDKALAAKVLGINLRTIYRKLQADPQTRGD